MALFNFLKRKKKPATKGSKATAPSRVQPKPPMSPSLTDRVKDMAGKVRSRMDAKPKRGVTPKPKLENMPKIRGGKGPGAPERLPDSGIQRMPYYPGKGEGVMRGMPDRGNSPIRNMPGPGISGELRDMLRKAPPKNTMPGSKPTPRKPAPGSDMNKELRDMIRKTPKKPMPTGKPKNPGYPGGMKPLPMAPGTDRRMKPARGGVTRGNRRVK